MHNNTQIWLTLKPSHIDENFESVMDYLRKASTNPTMRNDSLYRETCTLLLERVRILISERKEKPTFEFPKDDESLIFNTRLCAAMLLTDEIKEMLQRQHLYIIMMNNLIQLDLEYQLDELLNHTFNAICYQLPEKLTFNWDDIVNFYPNVFAHKVLLSVHSRIKMQYKFHLNGGLYLNDGKITISAQTEHEYRENYIKNNLTTAFSACDGLIDVAVKKGNKLRTGEENNIAKIEEFTNFFLNQQGYEGKPRERAKFHDGDEVFVVVTGKDHGHIQVKTVDANHEVESGRIWFDDDFLFKRIYTETAFHQALCVGDHLYLTLVSTEHGKFSITNNFLRLLKEVDLTKEYYARIFPDTHSVQRGIMRNVPCWTEDGFCIHVDVPAGDIRYYRDYCYVWVKPKYRGNQPGWYGTIFGEIVEEDYDDYDDLDNDNDNETTPRPTNANNTIEHAFKYSDARNNFIRGVVYSKPSTAAQKTDAATLNITTIKELMCTLNICQRTTNNPTARFKLLCVGKMVSKLIEQNNDLEMFNFLSSYLKNLVLFSHAKEDSDYVQLQHIIANDRVADSDIARQGNKVMTILSCFNKGYRETIEILDEYIDGDDDLLSKTASLVQSYNRLKNILEKTTLNGIKREIVNGLSIVMDGDSDLEMSDELGKYGIEDDMKEFKTSYFYAPANAEEQRQKINVFKGICAMLNRLGGTLYLGVNDSGHPVGLENDLTYLSNKINAAQPNLDNLMTYIKFEGESLFTEKVWQNVTITPNLEDQILVFNVTPYQGGIVTLEGVPYIRKNNSSAPIKDAETIRDIQRRRINAEQRGNGNIIPLLDAISEKTRVILRRYESTNSSTITDRLVEPVAFSPDYVTITCFEVETKMNKTFKVSHIGWVEPLKEKWQCEDEHKILKSDAFYMTGDEQMHVKLKLNHRSKNALIDQYPQVQKNELVYQLNQDEDVWYFEGDVYNIEPLGRFYISYADQIEIVHSPEIHQFVENFKSNL